MNAHHMIVIELLGSTPALVNPTLAVGTPTGSSGNTTLAMALERHLAATDAKHSRTPPKVASRSVHGDRVILSM